jgi:hypothetical protein
MLERAIGGEDRDEVRCWCVGLYGSQQATSTGRQVMASQEGDGVVVGQEAALLQCEQGDAPPVAIGDQSYGLLKGATVLWMEHANRRGHIEGAHVELLFLAT